MAVAELARYYVILNHSAFYHVLLGEHSICVRHTPGASICLQHCEGPKSLPSLPLPLEVCPLNPARGTWGSTVSSPSGVWGKAPAANDFGAFSG